MKKINSMDYLLVFGSIILFCSGISLMFNEIFNTYLVKTVGVLFLGIVLYILSLVFKYILKLDKSFKVACFLGDLSFLVSYVAAGYNGLFGSWFSINGEGVQIFLASIAFLVMLLSILTAILCKSYYYINITFISILVGVFHLLIFFRLDYQISLIIIGVILLGCNLFKFNKYLYNFSSIAIFIYALLTIIFGFETNFLLGSILFSINSLCILIVLSKFKSVGLELVTLTSFIILLGVYINYNVNFALLTVITVFIVCIFELALNTFKLVKNNVLYVIFKLIIFIVLISMAFSDTLMLVSQVIVFSFLIITTVANSYIIKHDVTEKFLMPFKLWFIIMGLFMAFTNRLVVSISDIYLYAGLSLLYVVIYKILDKKERTEKIMCLITNILAIICIVSFSGDGIVEFILANLLVLITYLFFADIKDLVLSRVFYTFIILMFLGISGYNGLNIISILLQIVIVAILTFFNYKDKYKYVITILALYMLLVDLIDFMIVNAALSSIISSIFYLTLVGISSEVLFDNHVHKNLFTGILITLNLLVLFEDSYVFIVNIYSLIISLIIILISLKNDSYKALYYIGIIMGAINMISLVRFLDGLPVAIYLFIIAVLLIAVVSFMVYRYQKRIINDDKKVKNSLNNRINFCGECGKKVLEDEKFCGNCGTKVK